VSVHHPLNHFPHLQCAHQLTYFILVAYTYDTCDIGTLPNQTYVNQTGPEAALTSNNGGVLSYLPGQRLSRCTCSGQDHPGPKLSDGTLRGRAAPEIDVIEAQVG
jgi:hypothetical protein